MASIIKPKRGSVAPTTANLVDGEIAINTADKKIYSNIGGTVYELSPSTATTPAGSNTQVQFNNSGAFGASSNFTFDSGTNALVVTGTIQSTIQIDAPYFKGYLLGATQQECRNQTGSLISKGTPVYVVGYSGNRVLIAPAEANNSAKMPAVGLLETDIADSNNGHYTILGVAKNLNTNGYAVNETLYVGATGGLTNVRPTGATTLIQNIGKVINVGNNGEILVMGPGRSNDVPNTITARTGLYTNDANGIRLYDLDSSNYLRLRPADTLASDINFIFPADVGTAKQVLGIQSVVGKSATLDWQSPAYLSDTQTFTAKQSFTSGVDITGAITGPGSSVLSIDNGAGSVVISAADISIGSDGYDFIISPSTGTIDGSSFEWSTGDLVTGSLTANSSIFLQNGETIKNNVNGRVDIVPAPTTNSFGLSINMTSKGTGARLTTIQGTTLSSGVLESLVELQSPKFTLTTTTPSTSVGGCLEYDGKVTYANTASGRGVMVTEQTSLLTSARAISNATGDQNIFNTPQDVITLAANTTYLIRGYLHLTMGTTTARHIALKFTESFVTNLPTINFNVLGTPSTNGGATRTQDSASFTTTSGGNITGSTISNNTYTAVITGMITTVDSVTITPQIAFSAAPGNSNFVNMGSYISFIPFGSNTMAAIGPWS
jgi:hypothetical protein